MLMQANDIGFQYYGEKFLFRHLNLNIEKGEQLGIVARSGFGKSTLARVLAGYLKPTEGRVLYQGLPLPKKGACPVQLIYQHPEKALNPRWQMKKGLEEAGVYQSHIMQGLGIEEEWLSRYPQELSGGELQRFCIARALGEGTQMILADEISTMLDALTQAQLWGFLLEEARKRELTLLIITHNKHLAERICTRVVNMEEMK